MLKRMFDFIVALTALVIFAPILLCLAVIIAIFLDRSVFFLQVRPGLQGAPFKMIKFRTMTQARDDDGNLLCDAERLTRLGRALRATSLDELPELWNVLKGEMSLVGPRPLLMEYLPIYSECQRRRHEVRPGITGWAQVNGRNSISWDDRFKYDVWYVENHSFLLDIKILLLTVKKVLVREGISAEGQATMPKFKRKD